MGGDGMTSKTTYEYAKMTWPEVNDAVRAGRVAVIPTGMIEDHGPHLPIDTDVVIANAVCRRAAELVPDEVVVLPSVTFGYTARTTWTGRAPSRSAGTRL